MHSQRIDIADSAALEIAGSGVVYGVFATPTIIGRERQHTDHASDPVVGGAAMEESAVTTIVLDHKEPHNEARARDCEQQAKPVADIERCPHERPEENKRPSRDHQFDDAAREVRRAILGKDLHPGADIGPVRGRRSNFLAIQTSLPVVVGALSLKREDDIRGYLGSDISEQDRSGRWGRAPVRKSNGSSAALSGARQN